MEVIELAGPIYAGKTKTGNGLEAELVRMGYKVKRIGEKRVVGRRFKDPSNAIGRQEVVLGETISELVLTMNRIRTVDYILLERGPWDLIAFVNALILAKVISSRREAKHLLEFSEKSIRYIDFIVLIQVPVEVSIKRGAKGRSDPIINERTLPFFEESYRELKKRLPEGRNIIVDGKKGYRRNARTILKQLFSSEEGGLNEPIKN